jgi:hypothetical protein
MLMLMRIVHADEGSASAARRRSVVGPDRGAGSLGAPGGLVSFGERHRPEPDPESTSEYGGVPTACQTFFRKKLDDEHAYEILIESLIICMNQATS